MTLFGGVLREGKSDSNSNGNSNGNGNGKRQQQKRNTGILHSVQDDGRQSEDGCAWSQVRGAIFR